MGRFGKNRLRRLALLYAPFPGNQVVRKVHTRWLIFFQWFSWMLLSIYIICGNMNPCGSGRYRRSVNPSPSDQYAKCAEDNIHADRRELASQQMVEQCQHHYQGE